MSCLAEFKLVHRSWAILSEMRARHQVREEMQYLAQQGCESYTFQDLVNRVKNQRQDGVCHVLAAGPTVNLASSSIAEGDFVIGMNFSALTAIPTNLYFVEFGGQGIRELSVHQAHVLDEFVRPYTDLIVFKNLWESRNDAQTAAAIYGRSVKYLLDVPTPILHEHHMGATLNRCLESRKWLRQYLTTTLSAVTLAVQANFRHIVLHGVDFTGGYFFDAEAFQGDARWRPPRTQVGATVLYEYVSEHDQHSTARGGPRGLKAALGPLAASLSERGSRLYAGSRLSGAADILPVWT